MGQIEVENPELFALEFGIIAESDFVYTPASTNIDQSAPNLVKMYMTIRSRMSSIMDVIRPELSELSTLELENFPYLTLVNIWGLSHSIYAHKVSDEFDYGKKIEPEHLELFALEFGEIVESDFVYTLASTNINQWAPNLVKMYVTIRSWMSLIMELNEPELS